MRSPVFRHAAPAALALACALPSGASAGNWSADASVSERVEWNSNLRLSEDSDGWLASSLTSGDVRLGYDTRRSVYNLSTGASWRGLIGPGNSESLGGFSDPRVSGSVVTNGKRYSLRGAFTALRRNVAFVEVDDTGFTDQDATETALTGSAGFTWIATPRDRFSVSGSVRTRRFSDESEGLTPSDIYNASTRWGRSLSERTELGFSLSGSHFQAEEDDGSETTVDSVTVGADIGHRPTPRHTFSLGLGVGQAFSEQTRVFTLFEETTEQDSFQVDASATMGWRGTNNDTFSFAAAHTLDPSADGDLEQTTRVTARYDHPLTNRTTLGVNGSAVRRQSTESLGGIDQSSTFLSFGPTVDHQLTRDWTASTGLTVRMREEEDRSAQDLGVYFSISRSLVLNR